MTKRSDINVTMTFRPKKDTKCGYCGISSFAHRHKAGTLPKDFERIELKSLQSGKSTENKTNTRKWSMKTLEKSMKINVKGYGDAIVVAALFKKIYGRFPEIGLSGFQAGTADALLKRLPESNICKTFSTK